MKLLITVRACAYYATHMRIHTRIILLPSSVPFSVRILTPDPVIALEIHQSLTPLMIQSS